MAGLVGNIETFQVSLSVFGRFHAFHLARQLEKRGLLEKIFTSYPYSIDGLRKEYLSNLWHLKALEFIFTHYLFRKERGFVFSKKLVEYFDCYVASQIKNRPAAERKKIFHAWSGHCRETINSAKEAGYVTVVEKSSAHIEKQLQILQEEYKRWGLFGYPVAEWHICRLLQEFNAADYIMLPSRYAYQSFLDKGFKPQKLYICPLGVDTAFFQPAAKTDKIFRIIFAGSISFAKGVQYLLEALSRLNLPKIELILAGGIEKNIRPLLNGYEKFFRYAGILRQRDLRDLYARSSLFVLPSLDDGFGMAVSEAMSCGIPVVVSENTGAKDIIREGVDGFIVPIRNVEILAEKILFFYEHPQLSSQMGGNARKRIEAYTWDKYAEQMIEFYAKIS